MPTAFTRRDALELLGALTVAKPGAAESGGEDGDGADGPTLNRFATTVLGAEITGLYLTEGGRFFFNVQHPDVDENGEDERGRIGALAGFDMSRLPKDFASLQPPRNEEQKRRVRTAFGEFSELALGGDRTESGEELGYVYSPDGDRLTGGTNPDFNGFVPAGDEGGESEGYLFTNWEHRPGTMSRLHLVQRGESGRWRVEGAENLDFSDVGGTWVNCFGTVTPWGTPLTSEENYAAWETAKWNDPNWDGASDVERLARYLGYRPNGNGVYDENFPNPYRYGYIVELTEPTTATPTPRKLFTLGRSTHENAVVMPDERTAYTTSDGTGRVFYKFVADEPGDLTAGTLYAAKARQDRGSDPNEVGFDLEWIELAHGTTEKIQSWVAEYDAVTQADNAKGETRYISDAEVREWARGNAADDRAAFLESGKAAMAKGATAEFRKMEGINVRHGTEPGDYVYVAMSEVAKTMTDGEGDVQLTGNEYGAVYRMRLDDSYDVHRMEPALTGGPEANICGGCPYDARPDSASTVCRDCSFNPTAEDENGFVGRGMAKMADVASGGDRQDPENTIANPDNVVVMDDGRVVIGEDSGLHENNMIWVFDPADG